MKAGKILTYGLGRLSLERAEEYCAIQQPPSFLYLKLSAAVTRARRAYGPLLQKALS